MVNVSGMPTLLERTEINAARRLVWDPELKPRLLLANRKKFLKEESHRLRIQHRGGAGGLSVSRARSHVMDLLLRSLVDELKATDRYISGKHRFALVAIGGYGRGELNPYSDVDIMFLHGGGLMSGNRPSPQLSTLTDGILYPLWDLGLKVGHSVRSLDDCVSVANSDMQSKTSLIEARLIVGDQDLFEELQKIVIRKCVLGKEDQYIQARLTDQEERRQKYGNSPLMQMPNIKNGCGGLRDFQNLIWMTFMKYQTRSLNDLSEKGYIAPADKKLLETAYDFLMRARNELHYLKDRAVDVIQKNDQPTMAWHLGHTNRSPVRRIESFMREYYMHVRNVDLITRTVEQRLALIPIRRRLPTFRQVLQSRRQSTRIQKLDGFRIVDTNIEGSATTLRERPRRLMRLFLHLQARGLHLHPDLAHHVRDALPLVNRDFLHDPHIHETFLEILNHPGNVAPILRTMHDVGLLGKYLPSFGRLTCLVQHEFFHQYTADEHTLRCIEVLDETWDAKNRPHSRYAEIFRNLERPYLLYLSLLLHDVGKARNTRNHADTGADIARKVAARLGLSESVTQSLLIVVKHHLLLSQVSQRLDLDDPSVINQVADKLKTPENLILLTLHTFCDSLGTSATLWNDFKDSLLWQLFHATMRQLVGGTEFIAASEKRHEQLLQEVVQICPRTFSQEEIRAHFNTLPPRYAEVHSSRQIMADLAAVHRFLGLLADEKDSALAPIVSWHQERDRYYTSVKICTWNRHGFFSRAAGAFAAAGMSILSAQIFSRQDGIIIDTFYVVDPVSGKHPARENRERFEELLRESLVNAVDFSQVITTQANGSSDFAAPPGSTLPTKIQIDHANSENYTLLEVTTEDHVGLLYYISEALSRLHLEIWIAKITTEKGAAIDTFYIAETEGGKVRGKKKLKQINQEILRAIDRMTGTHTPAGSSRS